MGTLLVVGSVSVSIALGLVLTKVLISAMLAVIPSIHGAKPDSG